MSNIRYLDEEHRAAFLQMLGITKKKDSYHNALYYLLSMLPETRDRITELFDFQEDFINFEVLSKGWQTSGTGQICRLAFNLWNGFYEEDALERSTPYNLFSSEYQPYFFQAIQLRYPVMAEA